MLLAALALILRLAVPAGWMPAADRLGLMPCAGVAPRVASAHDAVHVHHGGAPDKNDDKGDRACPFVGFAAAIAEPSAPAEPAATLALSAVAPLAWFPAAVAVGAGLVAPPPPPTGPPAAF